MIEATPTPEAGTPVRCAACDVRSCCFGHDAGSGAMEQLNNAVEKRIHLEPGQYLYRIGDPFRSLYSVRLGCLKNSIRDDKGRDHIMGFHLMGDVVGVGGIGNDTYIFDMRAVVPSEVCEIPFERLEQLAKRIPALSKNIIKVFARYRNRDARTLSLRREDSPETRVAGFVLDFHRRFAERGSADAAFTLPMPAEDIASYLWLSVPEVELEFARLGERGIVTVSGHSVRVGDIERLRALAAPKD